MASSAGAYAHRIKYKQDVAPPGGYKDFIFERTFPKTWYTAKKVLGIWAVGCCFSYYVLLVFRKQKRRMEVEHHDGNLALEPFIEAERDRNYIKWVRYMRDQESKVMNDVKGWQTGTWWGEPVYYTLGDKWLEGQPQYMYAHSRYREVKRSRHSVNANAWSAPSWYHKYMPDVFNNYVD